MDLRSKKTRHCEGALLLSATVAIQGGKRERAWSPWIPRRT